MSEQEPILEFRGQYAFLSNFFTCGMAHDGIWYPSSEHAFQAAKTLDFRERFRISQLQTSRDAKRAGKAVKLRPDWGPEGKIRIMTEIVTLKFATNPELRRRLLATGNRHLSEGNYWHDNLWGDCHCSRPDHPECREKGKDTLARILMQVRERLR